MSEWRKPGRIPTASLGVRLLVAGSRDGVPFERVDAEIQTWIRAHGVPTQIVHGGAPGVDTHAGLVAESLGIRVRVFPADWSTFGKSAGPRRNAEMARYATHALVIHHGSRGSLDMVRRARAKKLNVTEVRVERERLQWPSRSQTPTSTPGCR